MQRHYLVKHGASHIEQIEKKRRSQISINKKRVGKSDLLIATHSFSRQELIGYFFLLLLASAHSFSVSDKTNQLMMPNKPEVIKTTSANSERMNHDGQAGVPKLINTTIHVANEALFTAANSNNFFIASKLLQLNNLITISESINFFTKTIIPKDRPQLSSSVGCPIAGKLNQAVHSPHFLSQETAKNDELTESVSVIKKIDPIKTIQRVTYYQIYLIEYNDLYAHYPYFSLADHCNHLTQLTQLYGTIVPLVQQYIDLKQIKPCVEKKSKVCSYVNISDYMQQDLYYLHKYQSAKEKISYSVSNATQLYIKHLNEIRDHNVLFGHLMVLLKLNMHGGYYSTLIGLVDIFKRSGIVEIRTHTDKRKDERIVAGTNGAMGYLPYHIEAKEEINQWLLAQINNNLNHISTILKGYKDCFKYLFYIYQKILAEAGKNHIYRLMNEVENQRKIKLYTLQESKQYRIDAINDNIMVQIEYLANSNYSELLKKKGFSAVAAVDSEFSSAHSPLNDITVPLNKLPPGTLKINIIQEDIFKILQASWLDGNDIQEYKSKLIFSSSLNIDSSTFKLITKKFLLEIPARKKILPIPIHPTLSVQEPESVLVNGSIFKYSSASAAINKTEVIQPETRQHRIFNN
jgi:hypothetical protein